MTKSISPETKSSPMFAYAKINNLNNREATRFAELFVDTLDFETLCKSPKGQLKLSSYRAFCREPNINKDQYSIAITGDTTVGDLQTQSRSKLVMAYEKQRKAYLKIKELRAIKPTEVDEIMSNSNPYELSIPAGLTYRTAVLQEILRYISTTK
jgi:hypothetical protein